MNNQPIGILDSGVGGLSAVMELNRLLPGENVIYLSDPARIPSGEKDREAVIKYAMEGVDFLLKKGVKAVIAVCGTINSVIGAGHVSIEGDIPFACALVPAVQTACSVTRTGRIGVTGTPSAVKSGCYGRAIRTIRPNTFVVGNSCPLPEELPGEFTAETAKKYLEPIIAEDVDTLIVGCTHYPLLEKYIPGIAGEKITVVSVGAETAKYAANLLTEKEILSDREEPGTNEFYTTDSIKAFKDSAKLLLGHEPDGRIHRVNPAEI